MTGQVRRTLVALAGGAALQRGAQFATTVVIARSLSLDALGTFAVGMQSGVLLTMFVDSGVRSIATRETVRQARGDALAVLHASIRVRLLFAACAFLAFAAVVLLLAPASPAFWLLCAAFAFTGVFDFKGIAESLDVTGLEVRLENVATFGTLAGVLLLVASGTLGLVPLVLVSLGSRALYALGIFVWLRRNPVPEGATAPRHLLRRGGALSVVQFLNRAVYAADVLWIRWLSGSEQAVALFYAAAKIAQAAQIPLTLIQRLLQPHLAHAARAEADAAATLERVVRSSAYFILPIAVGGSLVAGDLLGWLYGGEFAVAGPVLVLLLLSAVFVGSGAWWGNLLFARREHRPYAATILVGTALNAGLSLWWVPTHDAVGSAAATCVATGAASALAFALLARRTSIEFLRPFVRPLFVSAVVAIAVALVPRDALVPWRIAAGAVAFGLTLYWLELRGGWVRIGAGLQRSSGFVGRDGAVGGIAP